MPPWLGADSEAEQQVEQALTQESLQRGIAADNRGRHYLSREAFRR